MRDQKDTQQVAIINGADPNDFAMAAGVRKMPRAID
jgi:hypothetical protein